MPNTKAARFLAKKDWQEPRHVQIYFDGTANNWMARTNVRRRFETAAAAEDPSYPCLYIEGVGTNSVSGKMFGVGMRPRVLTAYKFLARNWRAYGPDAPGTASNDRILIFGFSRGAFQARMLNGLMAHCGVPYMEHWHKKGARQTAEDDAALAKLADDVWKFCEDNLLDLTKEEQAAGGVEAWRKRLADNRTRLQEAMNQRHPGFKWSNPPVKLLALWDTVPGLSFNKLKEWGEPEYGHQRYKVAAYPNAETIVHALSLDDRRSKFEPLLVGSPIDPKATNVYEVWFPGAHSDVGGGYTEFNDMSGASFNWLHRIMVARGISTRKTEVYQDPLALLHHPEDLWMHRLTSEDVARQLPAGAHIDRTVFRRADGVGHPEEGGRGYVRYNTSNPISSGIGEGQVLSVAEVPKTNDARIAYLQKLGLVFHDDTGQIPEKALPEKNVQPLSISQMASAWNERPEAKPVETPPPPPETPAQSARP